ncbi:MAG: tetratricopeptide repeat protein [Phaeodactylibacter sp.]|nr:tetratricopeptide repeat protein [Phaeodactylibacter sp.]
MTIMPGFPKSHFSILIRLVRACLEAGFVSEKCQFFGEMRRFLKSVPGGTVKKSNEISPQKWPFSAQRLASKHALSIVLFAGCGNFFYGQASNLDSLQTAIAQAKADTSRILLENELARGLYKSDKDSALQLLQSSITSAEKINYKAGLFELWFTRALIHLDYNQLDSAFLEFSKAREIASEAGEKIRLIRALNALSYCVQNKRLGIPYLNEALEIGTAIGDKIQQARVMRSLGIVYSNLTEFDKAEGYYLQALAIHEERGEKKWQADVLRNLGNNAGRSNNLEKAIGYYEQGVELIRELGNKSEEAAIYNMMGYTCSIMGNFPKALEYSHTALKLMEAAGDKEGIADCYNRISNLYLSLEDYSQALFFIEKSYELSEEKEKGALQPDMLYRKGYIYRLKGEYPIALRFLQESFALKKTIGQTISSEHLYDLGYCFGELGRPDSALVFLQDALHTARETNISLDIAKSLIGLANIHFQQGDFEMAIPELKETIELTTVSGNKEQQMEAAKMLYRIYKSQNDSKKALFYHETYRILQDSLFNEKNARQVGRLEANYEFEKEKQQLAFEQEKELERQRFTRRLYLIALVVVLLFSGVMFRYYRSKQKANTELSKLNEQILHQKEKLEELDIAKSRLFTNISHEFRTPLTIISGMIDQISEKPDLWLERGAKMIKQNTAGLLNLVNQLLDLRKLESNELKVEMVNGDVVKYLRYVSESHQSYAEHKGLQLHFLAAEAEIQMDYDRDKLLRIVSNLLSNAIKFTPEGGNIYFHIDKKALDGRPALSLRVQDTGAGIPEEDLPHIFGRFYQADHSSTRKGGGTGIGLALAQELVKILGGTISAKSTVGKGSTFTIVLPITNASVTPAENETGMPAQVNLMEKAIIEPALANSDLMESTSEFGAAGKPHLLIVEDNPDVQQYLVACLQEDYQLTIAENGQIGIDKAVELIPDLIVSDVMMPEKDGYELTEALKNDERTDHIPIVLLTAKADFDSKMSGLEKGADAYLAKPFEKRELLVRLEKLLELRKKLQARYARVAGASGDTEGLVIPEHPFLQKFYALVEAELSNPELDMNQLSRTLGMSRSQVFKKLKALTGKSATALIRSFRLQRGKQLLAASDLTISEVAYEVGFTSLNYFSSTFFEEFGERPSLLRK